MRKKTIRLALYNRTEEIYEQLPKEYRDIIFNNILTKSLSNDTLLEEISLYLNQNETEEILKSLQISFKKVNKKRVIKKETYINEIKKEEKKNQGNEDIFTY